MKKIKVILALLLIISLAGIATAEEKTLLYYSEIDDVVTSEYPIDLLSTSRSEANTRIGFILSDVSNAQGFYAYSSTIEEIPDNEIIDTKIKETSHENVVLSINSQTVGSASVYTTRYKPLLSSYSKLYITIHIHDLDLTGFSGATVLKTDLSVHDLNIDRLERVQIQEDYNPIALPCLAVQRSVGSTNPYFGIGHQKNMKVSRKTSFGQSIVYNETETGLYVKYNRNNFINNVVITDNFGDVIHSESSSEDILYPHLFNFPITINATDPLKNMYWEVTIPEGMTPEELGKTKVTYKLVDTTQPYITLRGVYQIWEYHSDTDTFTDYDIGNINGETDIYFDTGKTYSIEFTNNDYKPFKIDYHNKIELVSKNNIIEMEKDEGDNITVSFRAENMDYGKSDNKYPHQYFRDFSITKNGETKYSNNAGYIFYENIPPQEFNIIAKTAGYDDYHKNYGVLDKTQLITVPLKSEGNYKFLSLKAYNGNNPSQTVATNYKIYVTKNGIETLLIETESMQGAFVYYLEVGFLHRVEYSSYGFKSGEIVFNPFFMDVVEKIYLYPEEEGINTLVFEIVDSKNIPSYGVRVVIGEEIKYTDTNGKTSFALSQGPVTYEIYKQGYQKISNSFNLTEDHLLKITLLKDGEVPPSTKPEIPPAEVKPSNIIESVKYAFSKMFGFNYNNPEDITKNNLLFGLIIVLGVATVVASVTKDGLGALVGGAIGFVFSSALGLIPIWVLLTGFAFIAIYIILFRISNDGGN